MILSVGEYEDIKRHYGITNYDISAVSDFLYELMEKELEHTKKKYPYATSSISAMERQLVDFYGFTSDIINERFGEE